MCKSSPKLKTVPTDHGLPDITEAMEEISLWGLNHKLRIISSFSTCVSTSIWQTQGTHEQSSSIFIYKNIESVSYRRNKTKSVYLPRKLNNTVTSAANHPFSSILGISIVSIKLNTHQL